jgi:hypothetical protein
MLSAMDHRLAPLERAFELARSGSYATVDAIKKQLTGEGYSAAQIEGGAIKKQLLALIRAARS